VPETHPHLIDQKSILSAIRGTIELKDCAAMALYGSIDKRLAVT
jgi:hypothetical protein